MNPQPLFFGRLLRILVGAALFLWLIAHPPHALVLQGLILFFGISSVVGGIKAYPGCEIMALPNLFLGKRVHCY